MEKMRWRGAVISVPQPLYLLVEDVGWWRGMDESVRGLPFRNRFPRDQCLEDYLAVIELAKSLSMRIGIGMILCEWDRSGVLATVPGATWDGYAVQADSERDSLLDTTAACLRSGNEHVEIALHGLCHEFWQQGRMSRSEFHDTQGRMRSPQAVRAHLEGFKKIMEQNDLGRYPRLFVPPALHHSFGNGPDSIQAILAEFGVQFVITRLARAHQYLPPIHEKITWEEGVVLLERGEAPVQWYDVSAEPPPQFDGPVIAVHWGNLLHQNPERNIEVTSRWAEAILDAARKNNAVIARDAATCVRQSAAHYLVTMRREEGGIGVDFSRLPQYNSLYGAIWLRIEDDLDRSWRCIGATCIQQKRLGRGSQLFEILPDRVGGRCTLYPQLK